MSGSGLPDILTKDLAVIFCGINPGATAAAAGRHFVSSTNRFWRVLHLAEFTPVQIDPANDRTILHYGYGLTTAVARPTRQAADLSRQELEQAEADLRAKIARYTPRIVAFLGKPAFAAIVKRPDVTWGLQPEILEGASVWVLPNPSGLNRNFTLDALVGAYRRFAKRCSRPPPPRLRQESVQPTFRWMHPVLSSLTLDGTGIP